MAYLHVLWIYYVIGTYATDSVSSVIGHCYDHMSYNSTGSPLARLAINNKLFCAAQCANRFIACNTAVFDSMGITKCLLFTETVIPVHLVVSTNAVVYDFQQGKSEGSTSASSTTTPTTISSTFQCNIAFTAQTTYSTGTNSQSQFVSVVDVNSDSKPDIIVANYHLYNIGVLLNVGNGTFYPQTTYSTGSGSYPQSVSVVDVNSDSKSHIIVANNGGNNVGVLLNSGNGMFLPQTTYSTGTNSYPPSASVADINSDGKPDIIVANQNLGTIGVLFNFGNGTFRPQTTYSTGNNAGPTSVVIVDINSDSKPDIIFVNYNAGNVGVLLNFGNGTFHPVTTYSTGNNSYPRSVSVVDVNNDSKPDIIVANQNFGNVGVFFNFGNGTFCPQTTYSTGNNSNPVSVAVVDINSDNKPDIIVANNGGNNVGVLLNSGDGTFLPQTTCSPGTNSSPQSVSVVDVNNDSKLDIIVANSGGNNIGVLLGH